MIEFDGPEGASSHLNNLAFDDTLVGLTTGVSGHFLCADVPAIYALAASQGPNVC